nr:hypothetical protein [Endozoicomonas sp.]
MPQTYDKYQSSSDRFFPISDGLSKNCPQSCAIAVLRKWILGKWRCRKYQPSVIPAQAGVSQFVAVNGLDAVGVTRLAADLAGSTLSRYYAINTSDASGKTLLVVENVSSLEDYAAPFKYLERMTAVREVSVHKVKGSAIELELTIDGSERPLADALALGRNLQAITTGDPMVTAGHDPELSDWTTAFESLFSLM